MRRLALCALGLGVLLYAASPYATLYEMDAALRAGDSDWMDRHVDWQGLNQGLLRTARQTQAHTDLAIAPAHLKFSASLDDEMANMASARLRWAFFDGLASFAAHLDLQGPAGPLDVRLELRLSPSGWQLVRVIAPPELLESGLART